MKILAMEREMPNMSSEDFKPYLRAEAIRVWELYQLGIFRELYFEQDKKNAVIILECKDKNEAGVILKTLPLVKEGLITFEIMALEAYSGFSRLFAERIK